MDLKKIVSHIAALALRAMPVIFAGLFTACSASSSDELENELRRAEMAMVQGDVKVVTNVLSHFDNEEALSLMSASQLGRLSILYMQMADSVDGGDYVANAADCYHRAYHADGDSASTFYSSVNPENLRYAIMLNSIVRSMDSDRAHPGSLPYGEDHIEPDSLPSE